jgi:hypothetical protein
LPSAPTKFEPQQCTPSEALAAHVCAPPVSIDTTSAGSETTGVGVATPNTSNVPFPT